MTILVYNKPTEPPFIPLIIELSTKREVADLVNVLTSVADDIEGASLKDRKTANGILSSVVNRGHSLYES